MSALGKWLYLKLHVYPHKRELSEVEKETIRREVREGRPYVSLPENALISEVLDYVRLCKSELLRDESGFPL